MKMRSLLACFAILLGLAACDSSSSSDDAPSELKASDITGLWYSLKADTSKTESSTQINHVHQYLRLDADSTLTEKHYSVHGTRSIDSGSSKAKWGLSGNRFIMIRQYMGETTMDTVTVALQDGNLAITFPDDEPWTQVFHRVSAITTPTLPKVVSPFEKTSFTMGSQDQSTLPSFLSIRNGKSITMSDLEADPANAAAIDVILHETLGAAGKTNVNDAHFWSPKSLSADPDWGSSSLVSKYFTTSVKATDTRFAYLEVSGIDDIATKEDFDKAIAAIRDTWWEPSMDAMAGDLIAIRTSSGSYAIIEVVAMETVSSRDIAATSDNMAVRLQLNVYKLKQ